MSERGFNLIPPSTSFIELLEHLGTDGSVRAHSELFGELGLHKIGPLQGRLQVSHFPAQIDGIDLEDISIGILVSHRPNRYGEHRAIHDCDLKKIPIKVEDDQ